MVSVAWLTTDISVIAGQANVGGVAYYRCLLPMKACGIKDQVLGRPAWTSEHGFGVRLPGGKAKFGYSTVVLKLLFDRALAYQIRVARGLGQRVVIDVDDLYEALDPENIAATVFTHKRRQSLNAAIREADALTVSTPYLRDVYSEFNRNTVVIRNGIDQERYEQREQSTQPVIGWAGALPWRSGDIPTVREWLPGVLAETGARVVHVGHIEGRGSFAEQAGIDPGLVTTTGMVPITDYPRLLTMFDIGIVPLNDVPFNKAKSFLKGLEYAAAGVLTVAQATDEYRVLAGDGGCRVAATPDEWGDTVTRLLRTSARARQRDADQARRNTARAHNMGLRGEAWRKVLIGDAVLGE